MAARANLILVAVIAFTIVNLTTSREFHIEKNNYLNWYEAHIDCVRRGYKGLATASSQDKESELTQAIDRGGPYQGDYFWVGLSDLGKRDRWVWFTSGKKAKYTNWARAQGKPESPSWTTMDCVAVIKLNNQWLWYNDQCNGKFKFVCEK